MKRHRRKAGKIRIDVVVLVILLVIFTILLAVYIQRKIHPLGAISLPSSLSSRPTPSPRPASFPLPTGKQSFSVSYGDNDPKKPKLTAIAVDPLTAPIGAKQTLTLSAVGISPITQINTTLTTDTKTISLSPRLIRGTATNGDWEVSWTVQDTTEKKYYLTFHLVSNTGVRDDDIAFR